MSRRVVLGKQANGTMGLRCSLAGIDALTGDSSTGGFSFDSSWTDIVRPVLTGVGTVPGTQDPSGLGTPLTVTHGLGYVPFMECRRRSGTTIFDDLMNLPTNDTQSQDANSFSGVPVIVTSSTLSVQAQQFQRLIGGVQPETFIAYSVIYVVFNIQVPNPS